MHSEEQLGWSSTAEKTLPELDDGDVRVCSVLSLRSFQIQQFDQERG